MRIAHTRTLPELGEGQGGTVLVATTSVGAAPDVVSITTADVANARRVVIAPAVIGASLVVVVDDELEDELVEEE